MGDEAAVRGLLSFAQSRKRRRCSVQTCYTHTNLADFVRASLPGGWRVAVPCAPGAGAEAEAPSAFPRSSGARSQAALRRFLGGGSAAEHEDMLEGHCETVAVALTARVARALAALPAVRDGDDSVGGGGSGGGGGGAQQAAAAGGGAGWWDPDAARGERSGERVLAEVSDTLVAELRGATLAGQVALLFAAEKRAAAARHDDLLIRGSPAATCEGGGGAAAGGGSAVAGGAGQWQGQRAMWQPLLGAAACVWPHAAADPEAVLCAGRDSARDALARAAAAAAAAAAAVAAAAAGNNSGGTGCSCVVPCLPLYVVNYIFDADELSAAELGPAEDDVTDETAQFSVHVVGVALCARTRTALLCDPNGALQPGGSMELVQLPVVALPRGVAPSTCNSRHDRDRAQRQRQRQRQQQQQRGVVEEDECGRAEVGGTRLSQQGGGRGAAAKRSKPQSERGDLAGAARSFAAALKVDPSHANAKAGLQLALRMLKEERREA